MKRLYNNLWIYDKNKLLKTLNIFLDKNQKKIIVTANAEIFMEALNNQKIHDNLCKNNIVIADGVSISKTAKNYNVKVDNIPGVELCEDLLKMANEKHLKLFVYGAKQEVLNIFKQKIENEYPNIIIAGLYNGYTNNDKDVVNKIIKIKPDICFIALGVPRQELFMFDNFDSFSQGVFIGVGGSIDVLSGCKKRAPKIFRKLKLEWFYRIMCEPKRIKRFFKYNVKFVLTSRKKRGIK